MSIFTKQKTVGRVTRGVSSPITKTVIDWDALGGFAVMAVIALVVLSMCSAG